MWFLLGIPAGWLLCMMFRDKQPSTIMGAQSLNKEKQWTVSGTRLNALGAVQPWVYSGLPDELLTESEALVHYDSFASLLGVPYKGYTILTIDLKDPSGRLVKHADDKMIARRV